MRPQADKLAAGLASREDDGLHCEGFALKIFGKADALDRSGRSDSGTARALYAAFLFFEVLRQFGELPPDLAAKQKYAAWRAADIRGALKEGRAPGPPPGGEEEAGAFVAPAPPASDCPQPPAGLQPPPAAFAPPPATASPLSAPSPARSPAASSRPLLSATPSPPPGLRPPVLVDLPAASASGLPTAALMAAQVAAKTAASALSFDDVPTAVAQLRAALRALGQG